MLIDKGIITKTIEYIEDYLDSDGLTNEEKGAVLSLLNFWRLYSEMA